MLRIASSRTRPSGSLRPCALALRGRRDLGRLDVEQISLQRATLSGELASPVEPGDALSVFFRFAGHLPLRATGIVQRCEGERLELRFTSLDADMPDALEELRLTDLRARFRDARQALAAR